MAGDIGVVFDRPVFPRDRPFLRRATERLDPGIRGAFGLGVDDRRGEDATVNLQEIMMKSFTYRTLAYTLAFAGTTAAAQAQVSQQGSPQPQGAQQRAVPQQSRAAQAAPPANAVAMVNGEAITRSEVQSALDAQRKQAGQQPGQTDPAAAQQIRQQVMNTLVESRLVEQHLMEQGPEVPGEEVQAVIDRYKQQFQEQGVPFQQFLASSGYTKAGLEKRIKGSLSWQKYQQQEVTDKKLQQHFAANQDRFPADNFEEAKPLVAQSYAGQLWQQIVKEELPDAEIKMVKPRQPATRRRLPNADAQ